MSINTGKTHVKLIHMNERHFDPVIPVSSHGDSEPVILCHEYLSHDSMDGGVPVEIQGQSVMLESNQHSHH